MTVLAPGLGPFGLPELLIIAFIIILIFGVGRLPEVGGAVGKSIREFRKATKDEGGDDDERPSDTASMSAREAPEADPSAQAFCSECGARNPRDAKFCAQCGHSMTAPVG